MKEINNSIPDAEDREVSLSECLSGGTFDNVVVVEATSSLSVSSTSASGRRVFSNPSVGLKLEHALAKCAEIKKDLGIGQDDSGTISLRTRMHFCHCTSRNGRRQCLLTHWPPSSIGSIITRLNFLPLLISLS